MTRQAFIKTMQRIEWSGSRSKPARLRAKGLSAALTSALFLGLAPVFGRQAILLGMAPLAVVAIRTGLAALLLLAAMFCFARKYLYIYPAGLLGCLMAGWINGLGSLFYYSALGRIDAGLGQLLYSVYPLFLALWMTLDNQRPTRLTWTRLALALPAVLLLVQVDGSRPIDLVGVGMMLVSAALYALHLPFNQRVLSDMPAPTVTLYTLIAMSAIVAPTFIFSGALGSSSATGSLNIDKTWAPLLALTLVTFFSRLTLFLGVKHLGGMQTAMLGMAELLVTLIFARLWLGEIFTPAQWLGAGILVLSLGLVALDKSPTHTSGSGGFLSWLGSVSLASGDWQPHD